MKPFKYLRLALALLFFAACNSENELMDQQACIDKFLEEFELNAFNGGEVPCGKNYLVLFKNETTTFAILHNDCADLQPQRLIGCNEQALCTYVTEDGCFDMVRDAENLGIIGVE